MTQSDLLHDEQLVALAQKDPGQFKLLYEKYFRQIFLFVLHRVGEKSLAADITSQVFLKALLNIQKFKYKGVPFSAWLFRIALNECNSFFRSSKRERYVSLDDAALSGLHAELTADTTEDDLYERLPSILAHLEEEDLQLIELRFFELRPFKEIGEILDLTETHAKVKVYRLLDRMKKIFLERNKWT